MVAISLYRGNLHRVPDVPRRWPMPPPAISLRHFKVLMRKRSLALSRLGASSSSSSAAATLVGTLDAKEEEKGKQEAAGHNGGAKPDSPKAEIASNLNSQTWNSEQKKGEDMEEGKPLHESQGPNAPASNPPVGTSATSEEVRGSELGKGGTADAKLEVSDNLNTAGDKRERKRELEKKLQVLNEKKHHLVQMLKQILNAEEEIKRRNAQPYVMRASIPPQAETLVDMGSVTRQVPKISVDVNFSGDLGGESDLAANHNTQACQLNHLHGTSPSAVSFSRNPFGSLQHNTVHSPRPSLAAVGHGQTTSNALMGTAIASPSRFAPAGHQGHSMGLPPVSLPGTNYMALSPSPAASGAHLCSCEKIEVLYAKETEILQAVLRI
ncbi:uncharacterized protein LOC103715733 isoform X1 [Phoenix dactylifera]|uniref:Uncharacterized protein LOC103715733 isoform X1 n=1 Tax=Phoenix dactylifera TaxID=42345 RepID=A0A8B8J958_PHODC|nr:uncharacterized protein LOC103715733 isoform X1 [Phoenix dactylifera]